MLTFARRTAPPKTSEAVEPKGSARFPSKAAQHRSAQSYFAGDLSAVPTFTRTSLPIQPKLKIGSPGDLWEREADRIAAEVMRADDAVEVRPRPTHGSAPHTVQRCSCGTVSKGSGKEPCKACRHEEESLHRKATSAAVPEAVPDSVHGALETSGQPLDASAREYMESRFGADFTRVRVHSDRAAAESASAISARAYTVGQHVVFSSGEYSPGTQKGRQLLAHELTHVMQQASDSGAGRSPRVSQTSEPRIQRQEAGVHASPPQAVPYEKSGRDVEMSYRRAGLADAANAVARCREGNCNKVITEAEAYQAYRSGRLSAGLEGNEPAKEASAGTRKAPRVVGAYAGPVAGTAVARVVITAARAAPAAGAGAGAGAAASGGGAAAAGGGAAAVGTIAVPIAAGLYVAAAIVDLVSYGSFQVALQRQGYTILPNILQVCISGCHQPAATATTTPDPFTRFGEPKAMDKSFIEDWLKGDAVPDTKKQDKRRKCLEEHPNFLPCEEEIPLEEQVQHWLERNGYGHEALGDCKGMGSVPAIEQCNGAPGESYHCTVKPYYDPVARVQKPGGVASIFACACCRADGTVGREHRGEHWSPGK